jgi:hypothetical protein
MKHNIQNASPFKTKQLGDKLNKIIMKTEKLTRRTNPTLWKSMTQHGAPKPSHDSVLWNDWASNNPQPEARALAGFDFVKPMLASLTGMVKGARPVDVE